MMLYYGLIVFNFVCSLKSWLKNQSKIEVDLTTKEEEDVMTDTSRVLFFDWVKKEWKFVGTVRECLVEYGKTLPTGKVAPSAREPLASYVQADDHTVYRWLSGKSNPIGENLIRCRVFLFRQGYLCKELKSMDKRAVQVAELVSDRKVSFDSARVALNYKTRDGFLAMLRGSEKISPSRSLKWDKFLAHYFLFSPSYHGKEKTNSTRNEERQKNISSSDSDPLRHQLAVGMMSNLVQAMEPVALYLLSDKFTDAERRQLRSSIPNDGLEKLARMLLALCSKRSRDIFLAEKKTKS